MLSEIECLVHLVVVLTHQGSTKNIGPDPSVRSQRDFQDEGMNKKKKEQQQGGKGEEENINLRLSAMCKEVCVCRHCGMIALLHQYTEERT